MRRTTWCASPGRSSARMASARSVRHSAAPIPATSNGGPAVRMSAMPRISRGKHIGAINEPVHTDMCTRCQGGGIDAMAEIVARMINPAVRAFPALAPDRATWPAIASERARLRADSDSKNSPCFRPCFSLYLRAVAVPPVLRKSCNTVHRCLVFSPRICYARCPRLISSGIRLMRSDSLQSFSGPWCRKMSVVVAPILSSIEHAAAARAPRCLSLNPTSPLRAQPVFRSA